MKAQIDNILQVRNLSITLAGRHRQVEVVSKIGFEIRAGQTLGLVGESGCGKSLTAQALLGLPLSGVEMLTSGSIRLAGREQNSLSPEKRREVRGKIAAIIFQDPMSCLNPIMTVGRQTAEAVRRNRKLNARQTRQKVLALFEEVGLPEPEQRYRSYPHELSGGQQQRVMITIALAGDPMLLIADEPTTALDVTIQAQVLDLLRQIQSNRKMAMLFISHDLNLVGAMADQIAVMRQGRIVEHGPGERILSRPRHPYTRALLACRPDGARPRTRLPLICDFLPAGQTVETATKSAKPPQRPAVGTAGSHASDRRPALGVSRLVVEYPRGLFRPPFRAVDHLDFSIPPGKTLGLVGESGSGKSTVARSIAGLQPFSQGRIDICGRPVAKAGLTPRQRARLCQLIMQNPLGALNPRLKIRNIILEPLRTHGLTTSMSHKKETESLLRGLLAEVGLAPEHLDRYPHQLSGGQRQRINIARALALDPKVLICDEIVSALDVAAQARVLNLLLDIQQSRELAILFIGHDLNVVRHVSDEIMVLHHGKVVAYGLTDAAIEALVKDYASIARTSNVI